MKSNDELNANLIQFFDGKEASTNLNLDLPDGTCIILVQCDECFGWFLGLMRDDATPYNRRSCPKCKNSHDADWRWKKTVFGEVINNRIYFSRIHFNIQELEELKHQISIKVDTHGK